MGNKGWVIIWESQFFNAKGVEPGVYGVEDSAIRDCEALNANSLLAKRCKVVPVDGDEHKAAVNHMFSWRK